MNKRILALLFGALITALVIAGCGSSSDSDSTESTEGGEAASITKADFVKQANSICKTTEEEGEDEVEEFLEEEGVSKNEEPSEEVQEKVAEEVVIPTLSGQFEEIRALGFPEGAEGEEAESILASAEGNLEEIEEEPTLLFSSNPFAQTNKKARAYGLTVCGSES